MNRMINVISTKCSMIQCIRTACAIAWARSFISFIPIYQQSIAWMDAFDIVPVFHSKLASCIKKASAANRFASKRAVRQSRVRKIHAPTSNHLYKYLNELRLRIHCLGDMRIRTWTARDARHRWGQNLHLPKRIAFTNKLTCTICTYIALKITH